MCEFIIGQVEIMTNIVVIKYEGRITYCMLLLGKLNKTVYNESLKCSHLCRAPKEPRDR